MRALRSIWSVRRPFGEIEIELYPDSVDVGARAASSRELTGLLYDAQCRDLEASRVVMAIYARLRGLAGSVGRRADGWHGAEVGEELLRAARAGSILVRRCDGRSALQALAAPRR